VKEAIAAYIIVNDDDDVVVVVVRLSDVSIILSLQQQLG
jgi:hypothetical protein